MEHKFLIGIMVFLLKLNFKYFEEIIANTDMTIFALTWKLQILCQCKKKRKKEQRIPYKEKDSWIPVENLLNTRKYGFSWKPSFLSKKKEMAVCAQVAVDP